MKKIYTILSALLTISVTLSLFGCAENISPGDALSAFSERYPLPAGDIYHSEAQEYERGYLSPDAFNLLYARPDGDSDEEDIQGFALFLGTSLTEVNEMGIFRCPDRDAAYEVSGMLRGRLSMIRQTPAVNTDSASDAAIGIVGTTVYYLVLPDNPAAERTLLRILS